MSARRARSGIPQVVLIAPGSVVDGFYVLGADVWWQNAFVVGLLERPGLMGGLVAGALVVSVLFLRVWRAPRVQRLLDEEAAIPEFAAK